MIINYVAARFSIESRDQLTDALSGLPETYEVGPLVDYLWALDLEEESEVAFALWFAQEKLERFIADWRNGGPGSPIKARTALARIYRWFDADE